MLTAQEHRTVFDHHFVGNTHAAEFATADRADLLGIGERLIFGGKRCLLAMFTGHLNARRIGGLRASGLVGTAHQQAKAQQCGTEAEIKQHGKTLWFRVVGA